MYLALPREVLAEPAEEAAGPRAVTPVPADIHPDPSAVAALADRIAAAEFEGMVGESQEVSDE